jgi:hypothetical protein
MPGFAALQYRIVTAKASRASRSCPMQYQQAAQSRADFAAHVSIACRRDYADIPVAEG